MIIVNFIYAKPLITELVSLVLAGLILWYLLQDMIIVQVFGTILFVMLLLLMGFASMKKEMLGMVRTALKEMICSKKHG